MTDAAAQPAAPEPADEPIQHAESYPRFLARDLPHDRGNPVPVGTVMQRNPITISPETWGTAAVPRILRRGLTTVLVSGQ